MALSVAAPQRTSPLTIASGAPALANANTVHWTGQDGNVYYKDASGVKNLGPAAGTHTSSNLILNGSREIADPNPGNGQVLGEATTAPTAPSNPNGTAAAAPPPDKSNDIALNQAGLSAADTQTSAGLSAIDKALGALLGQYDEETGANEKTYTDSTNTNVGNLQKNKQSAMVNAAQGRRGLFGTLQSLGALNGSGIDLANNAVKAVADQDLSGAADNYATNASNLDTSIGTYRREDKARHENANLAAGNAKTNVQNDAARSKQTFYKNIANDYEEMKNPGQAKTYSDMAASLYPTVAASNVPNANLGYSAAAFTAPSLDSYIAGAGGTQVSAAPTTPGGPAGQLPGLTAGNKRKQLQPIV